MEYLFLARSGGSRQRREMSAMEEQKRTFGRRTVTDLRRQ
jgi:hypothetical protein